MGAYLAVAFAIAVTLSADTNATNAKALLIGAAFSGMIFYSVVAAVVFRRGHVTFESWGPRFVVRAKSGEITLDPSTTRTVLAARRKSIGTGRNREPAFEHWLVLSLLTSDGKTMTFGARGVKSANAVDGDGPMYECDEATLKTVADMFKAS